MGKVKSLVTELGMYGAKKYLEEINREKKNGKKNKKSRNRQSNRQMV